MMKTVDSWFLTRFLFVGKDYAPNDDDIIIYKLEQEHLPKYEKYFLKFNHSKALDAALEVSHGYCVINC